MAETYETTNVAIDAVIFTVDAGRLKVLLHKREKGPFLGLLELPGGLLRRNESAEETLQRKMSELLGEEKIYFEQFFTFTEPNRDPRARTVSIGYIALVHVEKIADRSLLFDIASLKTLAFDHAAIIRNAREHLKTHIDLSVVKELLPETFPLNMLQEVFEIIEEVTYDNRNFRKKMLASGELTELAQVEKNVSHRPAKLYRVRGRK